MGQFVSQTPMQTKMGAELIDCDVVIVAHNAGGYLAGAVESASDQAGAEHVWLMDAESTDGSVDALRAAGSGIHVVPVQNRGFAAANNRGIQLGGSAFVLLLNPDAVLQPGALQTLLATALSDARAGVVGPLVVNPDGSVQAGSFGSFPSLAGTLKLHAWRFWRRRRGDRALSPRPPVVTKSVDWVTGAAMLVRRAAIGEAGPLDEGFFLYYEDVEWCHRMRSHGWEVLLEPGARVLHYRGGSTPSAGPTAAAYRASFYRYCDLHGLWGLAALSRLGLWVRRPRGAP